MTPRISLFIASLHVLLFVVLTLRVVGRRRAARVGVGSGGDEALSLRMRVHGNFSEYVPLALLMLALLELSGLPAALVWTLGVALLLGRALHAIGLGGSPGYSLGRFGGTVLTLLVLVAAALAGLWRVLVPYAL
jgi:uncharacterized membrane protein YecN with MAPEG domain